MHPQLMYPAIRNWVDRLRERYSFDLIDAHFVYPSGVVATRLARRYAVPVVLTGRGEDMLRFPQKPLMGERIRWALRHANRCIGVSQEIASAMIDNGAEPSTTSIVANGVDVSAFHPLAKAACRNRLGLPLNKQILLTVGDRLELKGFHLLVEAMPSILKHHPEALLVIVGGPGRFGRDYTDEIQSRIQSLGLNRRVVLAGPKPHGELASWYNAADLFVLMSSREGSPNVLIEALSCGTPSIGTAVGGIPDELSESSKGLLLPERTAAAASHVIVRALATEFDRKAIADAMRVRSWEATAQRLAGMLRETCDNHHIKPSR